MNLDVGQWAVIGVCGLLIIVYIRGYFYNRSLAARASAWLVEGLQDWGRISVGEKLPRAVTGGRLEVLQARPPFRKLEVVYLLAPRENPLFWIFYYLQGKRDELIVWVTFTSKPEQLVEVARPGDRQYAARLNATDKPALEQVEAPSGFQMAVEDKQDASLAQRVTAFLQEYQPVVQRVSLRSNKPHMFLRTDLQKACRRSAPDFFSALSALKINKSKPQESEEPSA